MKYIITSVLFLIYILNLDAQNYEIIGSIYDYDENAVIKKVKLVLYTKNKYVGKTKSDINGKFWFSNLKKDIYQLHIIHEDYSSVEIRAILFNKENKISLYVPLSKSLKNKDLGNDNFIHYYNSNAFKIPTETTLNYNIIDKSSINLLQDVYECNKFKISNSTSKIVTDHKATHFNQSFESLQKDKKKPF